MKLNVKEGYSNIYSITTIVIDQEFPDPVFQYTKMLDALFYEQGKG